MAASERKARLRRQREQELLDAAAGLFRAQDWRATTVDQIAQRCGIAKGTVYLHVRSKEELAAKLALRFLKRLAGAWRRVPLDLPPRPRLIEYLRAAQQVAEANPGAFSWLVDVLAIPVWPGLPAETRLEINGTWLPLLAALRDALDTQPPAGPPGLDQPTIAESWAWWLLRGALERPPMADAQSPLPDPEIWIQNLSFQ